jgi:hypothetical protein
MCIVTTLNEGLRNGGGIGDVLRKPSKEVSVQFCIALAVYPAGFEGTALVQIPTSSLFIFNTSCAAQDSASSALHSTSSASSTLHSASSSGKWHMSRYDKFMHYGLLKIGHVSAAFCIHHYNHQDAGA